MATKIFVNLPVKDLGKSREFFTKLGYAFDPQFTDDNAACMIVSEDIFVMLLREPFFGRFTEKEIVDARKSTEVILCLSAESKEQVDDMARKADSAGGKVWEQKQEHDFMYWKSFEDLDGHIWEVMWMDPNAGKS